MNQFYKPKQDDIIVFIKLHDKTQHWGEQKNIVHQKIWKKK